MPDTVSVPALTSEARRFLDARPARFGTLATINPDGTPHQAVLWYLLRDDGGLLLNSRVGRRWPANLLRDPRASFSVEDGYEWVSLRGEAVVLREGEGAQEDIATLARLYETPDEAERAIREFRTQERISFVLRPRSLSVHL
jgi:PPOX class probable F420-dependent enzyme